MSEQSETPKAPPSSVQLHNEQMKLLQFTADLLDAVAKDMQDMHRKVKQTNRTVQFLGLLVLVDLAIRFINWVLL